MKKAINFIRESEMMGYRMEGSIFKIDYTGKMWTVGFWLRPVDWNNKKQEYRLKGRLGRSKHADLDTAIELAIAKAKQCEVGKV